jgi:hypothetical protein
VFVFKEIEFFSAFSFEVKVEPFEEFTLEDK